MFRISLHSVFLDIVISEVNESVDLAFILLVID